MMKNYFLDVAGFVIKLSLYPTEHKIMGNLFCQQVESLWGGTKFLTEKKVSFDSEIKIQSSENTARLINKRISGEGYLLAFKRKASHFTAFYHTSFYALQLVIKELLDNLLKEDGFILHASSILAKKGILHVFLAPKEGGKSTVAKLLETRGIKRFSDDNLIVRKIKGGWYFFSPPFGEKDLSPRKMSAKIAKIYFLKKSGRASVSQVSQKGKILRRLLKNVWVNRGTFERERLKNLIDFAKANNFYLLKSTLDAKEMERIINED